MVRNAIDNCGRKIVLSTSPGPTPVNAAGHVSEHANMWNGQDMGVSKDVFTQNLDPHESGLYEIKQVK